MSDFIANDYDVGETIPGLTLESGEELGDAEVAGKTHDPREGRHDYGWVRLTLEGEWWEQIEDRVESEVLHLYQRTYRGTDEWRPAKLSGTVWVGEPEEASEPEEKELGVVAEVDHE